MEFSGKNARGWARLGQRGAIFGVALPELASENSDIAVVTADLALLSGLDRFKRTFPDRFFNVGIAEQNMIGVAAGLAHEGMKVFATTYAAFISMRSFEQARHFLGCMREKVVLVGSAAGVVMGMYGATHCSIEDVALMRSIPGMTVISPADPFEAVKAMIALTKFDGPAYLRLTGDLNSPMIYKEDYDLEIGRGVTLTAGSDVALIASGQMVHEALGAAKLLDEKGISCTVIDMHTIKPLDTDLIDDVCAKHGLIVTIEEHSIIGGLGSAVAEHISGASSPPLLRIGIPDIFPEAGEYRYLLDRYDLTAPQIAEKISMRQTALTM